MMIDFKQLIEDYNKGRRKIDLLSQAKLAREMVAAGVIGTEKSACNLIQYQQNGKARSIDFAMLNFLCRKFDKKPNDIITGFFNNS